ncbi:MAG: hypothetical protein KI790_15190 [Cyclobacteriaceae bacterium]|nr:hypothetical protein [Cyclobacteriaceae bacterium HetDA_MAG_MS6]
MQINCFYFGKFGYTIVPSQIREDIRRIKDSGATFVTLNVLEQDYRAAKENIDLTVNEILRVGMSPLLATERWFGMFGGVQHYPSVFTLKRPETQLIDKKGEVFLTELGPVSSLYHEKTQKEISKNLDKTFEMWGFEGLMWYEPWLPMDYSSLALQRQSSKPDSQKHLSFCQSVFQEFHNRINDNYGKKVIGWLNHPGAKPSETKAFQNVEGLDFFGWHIDVRQASSLLDQAMNSPVKEFPLGQLVAINHTGLDKNQHSRLESAMEKVLSRKPDILGYYYFPGNVEAPVEAMDIVFEAIKKYI